MGARRPVLAPLAGFALWLLAALVLRGYLETSMLRHSLVQLPLLALSGTLLVVRRGPSATTPLALPALLLAVFATAIWMLPRMLDASLASGNVEVAKLVSIPLLIGLPLGWSWPRLSALCRAFVWANLISMLLTLGWLYKAAPVRVCNFYLLEEQQLVGSAYLLLAGAVTLSLLPRLFLSRATTPRRPGARSAQDLA
jgi:hypothetical protein